MLFRLEKNRTKYGLISADRILEQGQLPLFNQMLKPLSYYARSTVCLLLPLTFFTATVPAATIVFVHLSIQCVSRFQDVSGPEGPEHE